jgi:DNA-binding Xre family transcriptional regulator
MLGIGLKELLEKKDRLLYWLAQETGTTYNNLYRLASGKTSGVSFDRLDRICEA